ncbi:MAG TPA: DNA polymerase III subunit delta' [Kofleriaceae bacterium]|nr:DNA polymerase III subunit delta' [Kofleriaceae bacterium]
MPTLADIQGQDRAVAVLRQAIAKGRLHHAFLFTGPAGVGKRTAALALATALNCEDLPGEGCGHCPTCVRIADGVHPDVITLAREGAAQIVPIETVRAQVVAAVGLPPHEARERVFLIDEATALQPAAANALLKTLEEPPRRTRFVLMTVAPDQLLPTIRSRCQRVSFAPLDAEARRAALGADAEPVIAAARALLAVVDAPASSAGAAIRLGQKSSEDKLDVGAAVELAAIELGARARAAITAGDVAGARRAAAQAQALLASHVALELHNAHGGISIEALAYRLQRGEA